MLRKVSLGVLALAAFGFSGSAMAVTIQSVNSPLVGADTATVGVNIVVDPTVSIWTSGYDVQLHLNGSGPNNATAAHGTLSMVSNIQSTISATVSGTLPDLPGGNGIHFFLFPNQNDAAAVVAGMNSIGNTSPNPWGTSAYAPTGALAWSPADALAGNVTKQLFVNEAPALGGTTYDIVYAANDPGGIPALAGDDFDLTVTYEIAPTP